MTTAYSDIVAAIDAAIAAWAGRPVTVSFADGRSNTYRSLDELVRARDYYCKLAYAGRGARAVGLVKIRKGGAI